MADEWVSGETGQLLENNQGMEDNMVETLKRKLEEERGKQEGQEQEEDRENEEPATKKMMVEQKCHECNFKCYNDGEMKTHCNTSHGGVKKVKRCDTCAFTCLGVWEMDFHCRSRGHKAKKDDGVPCKKCDYVCKDKDDVWVHKREHIPVDKLYECGDCVWVGDRLDNIRYHSATAEHKTKQDYEAMALAKAEAKGPKEVAAYNKKLAKDLKRAKTGK